MTDSARYERIRLKAKLRGASWVRITGRPSEPAKIVYVVRDFYTDVWAPFDTRAQAEQVRDEWNEDMDLYGHEGDDLYSITVYDVTNDRVISHD